MNGKKWCKAFIVSGMVAATTSAWASTATTTFNVTGTVVGVCTVSAAAIPFGTTIPATITSDIDVSANITVTCASGTNYSIALNAGSGGGSLFAARKMSSGTNQLTYSIYTNAGHTTVWGDGTSGSGTVGGTGTGAAQSIIMYGRITPQTAPTGTYSDMISVTLTY